MPVLTVAVVLAARAGQRMGAQSSGTVALGTEELPTGTQAGLANIQGVGELLTVQHHAVLMSAICSREGGGKETSVLLCSVGRLVGASPCSPGLDELP